MRPNPPETTDLVTFPQAVILWELYCQKGKKHFRSVIVNQNLFIHKSVGDLRIKYRKKIENIKIALKKRNKEKKEKKRVSFD